MSEDNLLTYPKFASSSGATSSIAIFAETHQRAEKMALEVESVGLFVELTGSLEDFHSNHGSISHDVVTISMDYIDQRRCDSLSRFDRKVAGRNQNLILNLRLADVDQVFGCVGSSKFQILTASSDMEIALAASRLACESSANRVRESNYDDKLVLKKLIEQVGLLNQKIDGVLGKSTDTQPSAFRFETPKDSYRGERQLVSKSRGRQADLPDPRLVRRIIRQRQARNRFFDGELFADPAWDMLLDLTAARAEHERVSVTSLCIASGVPATTALRWISQMVEAGVFVRVQDDSDKRRAFIALSDDAADAMARYFAQLEDAATAL